MTAIVYPMFVMGGLGVVFGCLLAFASKKFAVAVDPRQIKIRAALPGANCGGCGYPGCDGYAEGCVLGACALNKCVVGGAPVAEKIAEIMGVSADGAEPEVAFVRCQGSFDKTHKDCVYLGIGDCQSASVVPGRGPASCAFACLGFGTCVKACKFDAIHVINGVAKVDRDKCVGCKACVEACPRGIIAMVPKKKTVHVACSNPMPGAFVRKVCTIGCIGCQMCVKVCPKQTISMKGALAVINPAGCVNCGLCASKCPVHAIDNSKAKPVVVPPASVA
ncbi:RnfABCDGE type electron transport complex subunit B [Pyramidobacter sp. C12-8]|uniref:RnfABCDGE type electron transport complex subunit B n=1 Tax=Pyramidobacter sp. C12-8 TaxID=1943580 RepID=UPI00098F74E1|nr:RnfABCDGE type electron transport complex subunit B [Pyramidobacter sp. C12-8]